MLPLPAGQVGRAGAPTQLPARRLGPEGVRLRDRGQVDFADSKEEAGTRELQVQFHRRGAHLN